MHSNTSWSLVDEKTGLFIITLSLLHKATDVTDILRCAAKSHGFPTMSPIGELHHSIVSPLQKLLIMHIYEIQVWLFQGDKVENANTANAMSMWPY